MHNLLKAENDTILHQIRMLVKDQLGKEDVGFCAQVNIFSSNNSGLKIFLLLPFPYPLYSFVVYNLSMQRLAERFLRGLRVVLCFLLQLEIDFLQTPAEPKCQRPHEWI